jgi:diadenosine tetraphosphate (Ap4A) HIT family hydrolase
VYLIIKKNYTHLNAMSHKVNPIPFIDSPYVVYEGRAWNVILHRDNQSYLGRCIVYLKTRVTDDPLSLTEEERSELWVEILPRLAEALWRSFRPDRINYAHLANAEHFVHWHIVPRYEKDPLREFAGEKFRDERVGRNYAPAPAKITSPEVMEKICEELKKNF